MTALCVGLDPELWDVGNAGNRLALAICRRCDGCPGTDTAPHGVIRGGVAYSDTGKPLPICPQCGYPVGDYTGGPVFNCARCRIPAVAVPDVALVRARWMTRLFERGMTNADIAVEAGVQPRSVSRIRCRYKTSMSNHPLKEEAA